MKKAALLSGWNGLNARFVVDNAMTEGHETWRYIFPLAVLTEPSRPVEKKRSKPFLTRRGA